MVDDGLTAVGQLSAAERMSTMIVGLFKRARGLGLVEDDSFEFPLRREHLADALGLSLVHTIKTWTALRRAGLFEQSGGRLKLVNPRLTPTLAAFFEQERRARPIM
jgi:CRP-like cAMP-binding protein